MQFINEQEPDILCLQETKINHEPALNLPQYNVYFNHANQKGYSGTAILSKQKPLSVSYGMNEPLHDQEGRIICAEYDKFILINVYTPNAGRDLSRLKYRQEWDAHFLSFLKQKQKQKPLIICGDLNVAHNEIDIARPKQNEHNAGFTKEEREGFQKYIDSNFIDTFRYLHPNEKDQYSWWSYMFNARAKNIGWRIDYFLTSQKLKDNIKTAQILAHIQGSDHAPVLLTLENI